MPTGERASYIRSGLVSRGLPEHIADGFVANFQDESGLDPGINEANPTVPGSRGGFGLYRSPALGVSPMNSTPLSAV